MEWVVGAGKALLLLLPLLPAAAARVKTTGTHIPLRS